MKVMVFHIGADRYGLPLQALARVLPAAQLKQLPLAPAWVAGVLDLHGQPVPVIDLSRLAGLAPQQACFDTRILVVDYQAGDGPPRALGLLAQQVAGVETIGAAALADAGITAAPFLGPVASVGAGLLQLVDVAALLPPEVRALLFQADGAPA
jgi:chemotaxis-related protein WspB